MDFSKKFHTNICHSASKITMSTSSFSYKNIEDPIKTENINDESLIDEREQRIINFLESIGIELKSPLDKYYDYCDEQRKKNTVGNVTFSMRSKMSCNSLNNGENEEKSTSLVLNCVLYKKRKFSCSPEEIA